MGIQSLSKKLHINVEVVFLRKGMYVWSIHIFNFCLFISIYDQSNLFWSSGF